MPFTARWTTEASETYEALRAQAEASRNARRINRNTRATRAEGLFKQVHACLEKLLNNPRHPGLKTHKFDSLENPIKPGEPVFEAYVQNRTPGAYRLFWCYGPGTNEITIIAITPHP